MMDEFLPGSTIGHVNYLGAYLLLVISILGAMSAVPNRKLRVLTVGAIAVTGFALLYTRSIGAWVGLASAGLVAVGLSAAGSLPRTVRVGLALGCVMAIAIGSGVAATKLLRDPTSLSLRWATHRVGLAAIWERPLLGFGANGYERQHLRLEERIFSRQLVEFHNPGKRLSAHSTFLDMAVERGLLGLVAFVGLLASVLTVGMKGYLRTQDPTGRALLLGLLCGVTGFIVQAFTENLFGYSKVAAIFWIMAAAIVFMAESRPPQPS